MSFLSLVMTRNILSVMTDKRKSVLNNKTNIVSISPELIEKTQQVSKYGFFAITGISNDAITFIKKSEFLSNFLREGILKSKIEIEKWFNDNIHLLKARPGYSFQIYFGGLSKDNQLCAFKVASNESKLSIYNASEGYYAYSLSVSGNWKSNFIVADEKFDSLMHKFNGTLKSSQRIQYEMNKWVSEHDSSVSVDTDCFSLIGTK